MFDYTYDGIMRSVEGSRLRLGITCFDVAFIHDLDHLYLPDPADLDARFRELTSSGWRALEELRENARSAHSVPASMTSASFPASSTAWINAFLIAMPYTLLDQAVLDSQIPACEARGVGFVIGAVFASGILAKGPVEGARYAYAEPFPGWSRRPAGSRPCANDTVSRCRPRRSSSRSGHSSVASVIPGASSPIQQARTVTAFEHPIPSDLWAELKHEGLLRDDAPAPG